MAIETLKKPELVEPTDPQEGASKAASKIWEKEIDAYVKKKDYIDENMMTLYSLIWGQCMDIMRQKIEAHESFAGVSSTGDGLGLLKLVKSIAFQFQSQKY